MQHNLYHDNINSLLLLLKYSFHLFFQDYLTNESKSEEDLGLVTISIAISMTI